MDDDIGDVELNKKWQGMLENFRRTTGKDLREHQDTTIEGMRSDLKEFDSADSKRQIVDLSAKKVLGVAEFAASTVSPVFPQAPIIFNALKFLDDMVRNYWSYYTTKPLLEKLKGVNEHLDRIEIYVRSSRDGLDIGSSLKNSIVDFCGQILKLCEIYSKVARTSRTITGTAGNLFKAAIGYDGGVEAVLKKINDSAESELRTNAAYTMVSTLTVDNDRLRGDRIKILQDAFKVEEYELAWNTTHRYLEKTHVRQMGAWLYRDPTFASWVDTTKDWSEKPVIGLEAGRGHGKTNLCFQAIRLLREKHKQRTPSPPVSIAWLYSRSCDNEQPSLKAERRELSLKEALKFLILQLARSDRSFLKFCSDAISKSSDCLSNPFQTLIMDYGKRFKANAHIPKKVFYLLIDGVDLLKNNNATEYTNLVSCTQNSAVRLKSGKFQVRVFFTCNAESSRDLSFSRIEITPEIRRQEAALFVAHYLDMQGKGGRQKDSMKHSLESLKIKLAKEFTGSYFLLSDFLEVVKDAPNSSVVSALQREESQKSSIVMGWQLQKLHQKLSPHEITILNQFLVCLTCWNVRPTIDQLAAFLQTQGIRGPTPSIHHHIREKYPALLNIKHEEHVQLEESVRSLQLFNGDKDSYSDASPFAPLRRMIPSQAPDENHTTTSGVHCSSLHIIPQGNLQRCVCTEHNHTSHLIGFNQQDGHLRTVVCLLRAVCTDDRIDSNGSLCEYAATALPYHLKKVRPNTIESLDSDLKEEIGQRLYGFFRNGDIVDLWLPKGTIVRYVKDGWLESLHHVFRWLEDASVREGARKAIKDQEALQKFDELFVPQRVSESGHSSDSAPPTDRQMEYLLHHLPEKFARQWLLCYDWDAADSLRWLLAITKKSGGKHPFEGVTSLSKAPTVDTITKAEQWARELLKPSLTEQNDIICIRVAQTLIGSPNPRDSHYNQAEAKFDKLLEFEKLEGSSRRRAAFCRASIRDHQSQPVEALSILAKVHTDFLSKNFKQENEAEWRFWHDKFWDLCNKTNNGNMALKACYFLAGEFLDEPSVLEKALEWIKKRTATRDHLRIFSATPINCGHSLLATLLQKNATDSQFHYDLYLAFKENHSQLLRGYFEAVLAVSSEEAENRTLELSYLRYYYGLCMFHDGDSNKSQYYGHSTRDALVVWEENVKSIARNDRASESYVMLAGIFSRTSERLASAYIQAYRKEKSEMAEPTTNYLDKMRRLKELNDDFNKHDIHNITLQLGRLYYLDQQTHTAKAHVRTNMSAALAILSDDSLENDFWGYLRLADVFMRFDDKENTLAAWSLITCAHERDNVPGQYIWCDSECGWEWNWVDNLDQDIYLCTDCADVAFNRTCVEKLKGGVLDHRMCGRDHHLITIPKRNRKMVNMIKNEKVRVGRKELKIERWLEVVRHQYGIPNDDLKWTKRQLESFQIAKWKVRDIF